MVKVKPLNLIAQKYTQRAQNAAPDYKVAIDGLTPEAWEGPTMAAAQSYADGVSMAVTQGRFARGVSGSGARWKTQSADLGAQRYPQGVSKAGPAFTQGFTKYHGVLNGLTLGPRGPRGDARNKTRATEVMDALHAARISG